MFFQKKKIKQIIMNIVEKFPYRYYHPSMTLLKFVNGKNYSYLGELNGKLRHGRGMMSKDGKYFEGIFENDFFIYG